MDDRKHGTLKPITVSLASGKAAALFDEIAECSDARKSRGHRACLDALLSACSDQAISASEIRSRKWPFLSDAVRSLDPKLHKKLEDKNFFDWDSRKISFFASKAPKHPAIGTAWREKHGPLASLIADTLCEISLADPCQKSRRHDCDNAFIRESQSLKNNPQLAASTLVAAEKVCEIFLPYASADLWGDSLSGLFYTRIGTILPAKKAQELLAPLWIPSVDGAHARWAHKNWHEALRIAIYDQNIELFSHLIEGLAKHDPHWARHKVHFSTSRGASHFSWFEYACHEGFIEVAHYLHGIGAHKQLLAESDHFNPFTDLIRHVKKDGTHQPRTMELLSLVALDRAVMLQAKGMTREQAAAEVEKNAAIESTHARSGKRKAAFDLLALRFCMALGDWAKDTETRQPKEIGQRTVPRL